MTKDDLVIEEVSWLDNSTKKGEETPESCPNHCVCDDHCGRDADFEC